MELWDLYTEDRQPTGLTMVRGSEHPEGYYRLVVHVCIFNSRGQMLIQQRQPFKDGWPNMWDVSVGGSVVAGESSREAAERERLRRERERAEREAAKIKKVDITITSDAIKEIDEEIKSFECPITNTTMKDPIITTREISFEKSAIEDWLNKHNTCPVTNKPLNKKDLIKNIPLKNAITEYSKTKK